MTRIRIRVVLLAALALAASAAVPGAQLDISKPIPIKTVKPRLVWFRGEVTQASPASITVRSGENERLLRTFAYSPKVRAQMQKILDRGAYQYGDKVAVQYEAGSDVALQIKGKPSRPL